MGIKPRETGDDGNVKVSQRYAHAQIESQADNVYYVCSRKEEKPQILATLKHTLDNKRVAGQWFL